MEYFPVEGLMDLLRENAPKKQAGREGAQPLLRWCYGQEAKLAVTHCACATGLQLSTLCKPSTGFWSQKPKADQPQSC